MSIGAVWLARGARLRRRGVVTAIAGAVAVLLGWVATWVTWHLVNDPSTLDDSRWCPERPEDWPLEHGYEISGGYLAPRIECSISTTATDGTKQTLEQVTWLTPGSVLFWLGTLALVVGVALWAKGCFDSRRKR